MSFNAIRSYYYYRGGQGYPEYPGATLTEGIHSYASTFDDLTLTSLKARYYYPADFTVKLPVLIVMHGYQDTAINIGEDNYRRFARYGYFVLAVELRGSSGSGGSGGTADAAGREVFDMYDAYKSILTNFSDTVDANRLSVVGFSGGGGNALVFCSRFPDLAQVCVDYFGISDWGYDATYGWYNQESDRQDSLTTLIGGTPATVLDNYHARYSKSAIAKNFQGYLYMFHSASDTSVHVDHSQRVRDEYVAEGRTDYTYSEDSKWVHAYPTGLNDLEDAEAFWKSAPKTQSVVSVPTSGTMKILGSLVTKRFTIHLSDGNENNAGRSRVGTLVYDTAANTYTITPDIDAVAGYVVATVTLPDGRVVSKAFQGETTLSPVDISIAGLTPSMRLRANNILDTTPGTVDIWVDACGGPNGQGYAVRNTAQRPAVLATDINSLPAIEFNSSDYLQGNRHRALIGKDAYTRIVVGTGVTLDHGFSATLQSQHAISSGSYYVTVSNGSTAYGSYASTVAYKVRSDVFNGTEAANADRLKCYEDKVAKSLTFSGTIAATTESNTSSVHNIGKRNYDGTYLNGKVADYILFEEALSTANREAVEDELKTLYAI